MHWTFSTDKQKLQIIRKILAEICRKFQNHWFFRLILFQQFNLSSFFNNNFRPSNIILEKIPYVKIDFQLILESKTKKNSSVNYYFCSNIFWFTRIHSRLILTLQQPQKKLIRIISMRNTWAKLMFKSIIQGLRIKEELLLLHVAASIVSSAHCKMSCRFDFPCFATINN